MIADRWIGDWGLRLVIEDCSIEDWRAQSAFLNLQSSDRQSPIPHSATSDHHSSILNDKSDVF
jgi:hypothetical protein